MGKCSRANPRCVQPRVRCAPTDRRDHRNTPRQVYEWEADSQAAEVMSKSKRHVLLFFDSLWSGPDQATLVAMSEDAATQLMTGEVKQVCDLPPLSSEDDEHEAVPNGRANDVQTRSCSALARLLAAQKKAHEEAKPRMVCCPLPRAATLLGLLRQRRAPPEVSLAAWQQSLVCRLRTSPADQVGEVLLRAGRCGETWNGEDHVPLWRAAGGCAC